MSDTATASLEVDALLNELSDALLDARNVIAAQLRRIAPQVDVGDIDRYQPLREELGLDTADLSALVEAISQTTGITMTAGVIRDRTSLEDLAFILASRKVMRHWHVEVTFTDEPPAYTSAHAHLTAGLDHLDATCDTRKNPADPWDAGIGHELAAARALTDLARQLFVLVNERVQECDPGAAPITE